MKRIISLIFMLLFLITFAFSEVVMIRNWDGLANAVFIKDNILITNKHCLYIVFGGFIAYANYKQVYLKPEEIQFFGDRDIIVVKVDRNDLRDILGLKEENRIGLKEKYKKAYIQSYWFNSFIYSILGRVVDVDNKLIYFENSPVYQGMSGSPVYMDNYLVGIVSMGNRDGELIVERITEDILDYIKGGK